MSGHQTPLPRALESRELLLALKRRRRLPWVAKIKDFPSKIPLLLRFCRGVGAVEGEQATPMVPRGRVSGANDQTQYKVPSLRTHSVSEDDVRPVQRARDDPTAARVNSRKM